MLAIRICGSDMHGYNHGGVGGVPVTEPNVMGHESSGEVIAVGDLVKTHKIGDRVASGSSDSIWICPVNADSQPSRAEPCLSEMCQL